MKNIGNIKMFKFCLFKNLQKKKDALISTVNNSPCLGGFKIKFNENLLMNVIHCKIVDSIKTKDSDIYMHNVCLMWKI